MRKVLIFLFALVYISVSAEDKYLSFTSGYVSKREFNVKKSISESNNYIDVTYTFNGGYVNSSDGYSMLAIPEALYVMEEGSPKLPYFKDHLAIGSKTNVKVSIVKSSYKEYSSFSIPPSEGVAETSGTLTKGAVYNKNALYPSSVARLLSVNEVRDVPVAGIDVYPVRYNPVTKKVRCYSSITYRVSFDNKDWTIKGSKSRLDIVKIMVDNPDYIAKKIETKSNGSNSLKAATPASKEGSPEDFIILTVNKYNSAVRKFASFKSRQGYKCSILKKDKWTTNEVISTLKEKYNSCIPSYLLIFGDFADVPGVPVTISHNSKGVNNGKPLEFYTDKYYGNREYIKTGDQDNYGPDVTVGRISVENLTEANTVVDKIIKYESTPPTDGNFYGKALFAGDWISVTDDYRLYGVERLNFISPLEKLYKELNNKYISNIDRVYTAQIQPSLMSEVEYTPSDYYREAFTGVVFGDIHITNEYRGSWDNWYVRDVGAKDQTGAKEELISKLNEGVNFVIYGCHGNETALEAPFIDIDDVDKLNNGDNLPIIFCGIPCKTGTYKDNCLAERFLRKKNGGAIAYIGNSTTGISPQGGYSTEKFIKKIYINNHTKVANINNIIWPLDLEDNAKLAIKKLFSLENHFFGDPSMDAYTPFTKCLKPTITVSEDKVTVSTGTANCKVTITDANNPLNTDRMRVFSSGTEATTTIEGIDYPFVITVQKEGYFMYTSPISEYIQNESFSNDISVSAASIYAGYNVTDSKTKGNVIIKKGNVTFKASNLISLKSGFSVKTTANKFEAIIENNEEGICAQNNTLKSSHIAEIQNEIASEENSEDSKEMHLYEPYPNPTTDVITISIGNETADITICNSFGKILKTFESTSGSTTIDLSDYDKGIYFVTVRTAGHVETNKIILQ